MNWLLATTLAGTMAAAASLAQVTPHSPKAFPPDLGPATLTVTGVGGKSIEITVADMANFPQHTIKAAEHGVPVSFDGVLLKDVLSRVELPIGDEFHKTAASYYLVVEAADGYRAVFAWAELDATFMEKPVYLVFRRDGKPLPAAEGPFEVIAPGEKRNARWVHQVTALIIRQAS